MSREDKCVVDSSENELTTQIKSLSSAPSVSSTSSSSSKYNNNRLLSRSGSVRSTGKKSDNKKLRTSKDRRYYNRRHHTKHRHIYKENEENQAKEYTSVNRKRDTLKQRHKERDSDYDRNPVTSMGKVELHGGYRDPYHYYDNTLSKQYAERKANNHKYTINTILSKKKRPSDYKYIIWMKEQNLYFCKFCKFVFCGVHGEDEWTTTSRSHGWCNYQTQPRYQSCNIVMCKTCKMSIKCELCKDVCSSCGRSEFEPFLNCFVNNWYYSQPYQNQEHQVQQDNSFY